MSDLEDKYALFALTEDMRKRLVQLAQLHALGKDMTNRVVVEIVVVQHGDRTVIEREERGG
jgi:hypothetical protein